MIPGKSKAASMLAKLAHAHDGVEEGVACAGTAIESRTYIVRKKAFLFVQEKDDTLVLRMRLGASFKEAEKLAATTPKAFEAGRGGWVKLAFATGKPPREELLKRWISESYSLYAPGKPGT